MSNTHVCPWWAGYTLNWNIRRIVHSPERILAPYLKAGQTMLDVGCGMGYFTIPAARLLGEGGRIIAADMQQEMLDGGLRRFIETGFRIVERPRIAICRTAVLEKI